MNDCDGYRTHTSLRYTNILKGISNTIDCQGKNGVVEWEENNL